MEHKKGNIDDGFKEADLIIEKEFETPKNKSPAINMGTKYFAFIGTVSYTHLTLPTNREV
mgnify:CR=1 FL=1